MKTLRWLAVAVLAPLLSGCVDVEQTLVVESESSATLQVTASVTSSALDLARQYPQAAGQEFCAQPSSPDVHGLTLSVEAFSRGADQVCVMRARGTLSAIAQAANDKLYLPPGAPPQANALDYRLENLGGEIWRLSMTLTPPQEFLALAGTDDMARAAQMMMLGPVEGRALTWSVTADGIVDSTGVVSEDRSRAEFSIGLAEILTRPEASYSFETVFRAGP